LIAFAASSKATEQNTVGRGEGRGGGRGGAGRGEGLRGRGRGSGGKSTALAPVSRAAATAEIFDGDALSNFLNPQPRRLVSVPHKFPNVQDYSTCIAHNLVFCSF